MIDRTHPDLAKIIRRTIYAQFVIPTVVILSAIVLKLATPLLPTVPLSFFPMALLIAYSVGAGMIAVYNLVNLFTKLAQRKSN